MVLPALLALEPPFKPFVPHARLAGQGPVATPVAGTSWHLERRPPPCGVLGHRVEGEGDLCADGLLGVRRIRWLLQCLHLMVTPCITACPIWACLTAPSMSWFHSVHN